MRDFRPVAECEVVLAFVRREIDSDRFGNDVRRALADAGGLQLVRSPDLGSEVENWARECALGVAHCPKVLGFMVLSV